MIEWALLAGLVAIAIWIALRPEVDEPDEPVALPPSTPTTLHDDLGALNYGTASAIVEAERRLLSRGPAVVPELFRIVERLDEHPQSLTPTAQMRVEDILVDFRLAGVLALRDRLQHLRPERLAYASAVRVLGRAGPMAFDVLVEGGDAILDLFLDPLVARAPRDWATYLDEYGARLPERSRRLLADAIESARQRDGVRVERAPDEQGGAPPTLDAVEREQLVRRLETLDEAWVGVVRRVRHFAPEDADEAVVRAIRSADESVPSAWLRQALRPDARDIGRALVDALASDHEWRRARAVEVSRALPAADAVEVACRVAGRFGPVAALASAGRLLAGTGHDGMAALHRVLRAETDANVCAGACRLAGRLPAPGHTEALLAYLDRAPGAVRSVALNVELQGAAAVVPLLRWMRQYEGEPPATITSTALRVRAVAERTGARLDSPGA